MTEFITLVLILILVMFYFAVTFYANNKVYIDLIVLVVIDRWQDYIEWLWDEIVYRCIVFRNRLFK